jgi:hypothetical protein
MKTPRFVVTILAATLCLLLIVLSVGCNEGKADPKAEAPPKAVVEPDLDANNFKVDHPELFPLVSGYRIQSRARVECDRRCAA